MSEMPMEEIIPDTNEECDSTEMIKLRERNHTLNQQLQLLSKTIHSKNTEIRVLYELVQSYNRISETLAELNKIKSPGGNQDGN